MKKTIRWLRAGFPSVLAFTVLLAGCGSSYSGSAYVATTAAAAYDMDGGITESGMGRVPAELTAETMAAPAEAPEAEGTDAVTDASGIQTASLPSERKLIRNVTLQVETTRFDDLITAVQSKAASLGGYIEQSDISGSSITELGRPSKKYASMTLRIPASQLDAFLSQVETDGNVTYRSENVSDVTLQYSDTESRLKTLRMEQERLWELMEKAETTEAIIALEQRLTEVSSEIETSESRLRHYDQSVSYSTVSLSICEVDLESPTQPETTGQQILRGFTQNLDTLGTVLTAFVIGLLANSPFILFFALLLFLILFLIRQIQKKKKRQKKDSASKPSKSDNPTDS